MTFKQYFRTTTITVGEEGNQQKVEVSQWVASGTLLVSLEEGGTGEASAGEIVLSPGEYVEYSANKQGVLASVAGYPHLKVKKEGSVNLVTVSLEPMIALDEDGWSARLTLYPPIDGQDIPDEEQISKELENAGVRWGVRERVIASARTQVEAQRLPAVGTVVAKGRLPVNGQNGKLRIEVTVEVQAGEEQSDGSMDFRERNMFIAVDAGQLVATRIPPTTGLAGVTIYGNEVPQTPGRDLPVKSSNDVHYDEKTGQLRAAFNGVLSVINDTAVKVTNKYVVKENIDYSTGNVKSKGAVDVGGSIRPGFVLKAIGDVVISGLVESAKVEGGANVIVFGGVTGKQSTIEADGDVRVLYIEEGRISCQGAVHVHNEVYYADISCLGGIVCGPESRVIGCKLFSGGSMELMQVDTPTSPNSILAAAVDYRRYDRYIQLLGKVTSCEKNIAKIRLRLGPDGTSPELRELEGELADFLGDVRHFNLIPTAPDDDASGGLRHACGQKIKIGGIIQAGAKIRIGNCESVLHHTCREGYFALNGETLKITFYSAHNPLKNIVLQ